MNDIVVLRSVPVELTSDIGRAFVTDACRAGEGLITDRELAEKYELDPPAWIAITKNVELGRAVRAERERRVLNGTAVREMASKHLVKGPGILDGIMNDVDSNARHRIEAIKELRATAAIGSTERQADATMFSIRIDLSADGNNHVEVYEKPLKPDAPTNLIEGKPDAADDQW